MAGSTLAKMTIRVSSTRGATTLQFSTTGRYVSFPTTGLTQDLTRQPILPTATLDGFWLQVLSNVQAAITAAEGT